MERLQELINQLNEQFEHEASPSQMLQTARLLEAELAQLSTQAALRKVSANVAVMMPSSMKIYTGEAAMKEFNKEEAAPKATELRPSTTEKVNGASSTVRNGNVTASNGAANNGAASNGATVNGAAGNGNSNVNGSNNNVNGNGQRPIVEFVSDNNTVPEMVPEQNTVPEARLVPDPATPSRSASKEQAVGPWPFDPLAEIPTLAQQQPRELNDVIGAGGASLNDKLKSNVLELKSALNDTPVRDLKKAIGVNDRFVFISQLFRGDEVMYERSLKTINGFRILPEAEYWMERELKVKLGWDENREATKHFYQLVRRRFS